MKGKKSIEILVALSAVLAVLVCVLLSRIATISHGSLMIDGRPIDKNDVTITQHIVAPDGMHYVNIYTDQGGGATFAPSAYVSVTAVNRSKTGRKAGMDSVLVIQMDGFGRSVAGQRDTPDSESVQQGGTQRSAAAHLSSSDVKL